MIRPLNGSLKEKFERITQDIDSYKVRSTFGW